MLVGLYCNLYIFKMQKEDNNYPLIWLRPKDACKELLLPSNAAGHAFTNKESRSLLFCQLDVRCMP